jgi:hypothetical protein
MRADGGDVFWGAGRDATLLDFRNITGTATGCTYVNGCRVVYRDLSGGNSGGSAFSASDLVMTNVRCFNNRITCVGGGAGQVGMTWDNVECDGNGWDSALLQWDDSCIKMQWGDIVIRNSYIHDNPGNGLWWDYCSNDTGTVCRVLVENSRIIHNGQMGISWEVSGNWRAGDYAIFRNNVIQDNGWNSANYNGIAGVVNTDGSNLEIYGNTFGGNLSWHSTLGVYCCLGFVQWEGTRDPAPIYNVTIHDNTMNGDRIAYCTGGCTEYNNAP